ncbi:MAG: GGDEF domain-containing protein [Gemmatimonadaceae bacterium]|nr:GGDEF domain-containing protein [Gemmatimonadaceae bacterium]
MRGWRAWWARLLAAPAAASARPASPDALALRGALQIEPLAEAQRASLAHSLVGVLGDIATQHEAEWVLVLRWLEAESTPELLGASEALADAEQRSDARVRAFALWAAREQVTLIDQRPGADVLVAAPIALANDGLAALVLGGPRVLVPGDQTLKEWAARHARRVGEWIELLLTRDESARQNRQTRALLRAAQAFQQQREPRALEAAVAHAALEVAGGSTACVVRWDPIGGHGSVSGAAEGMAAFIGTAIDGEGAVAECCRDGQPRVWEDARAVPAAGFLGAAAPWQPASALVVPIRLHDAVVGAVVVGGDAPHSVRAREARLIGLLAAIAATALETAWEMEEATRRSRTDPLTGLANRRAFEELLQRVLAEATRFGTSCALAVIDIDHFKRVNDTHGHDVGDAVLQTVAHALQEGIREVDLVARLGGEELAVLSPQTDAEGARELSERLRQRIEARVTRAGGVEVRVTASVGVAVRRPGDDGPTLFKRADRALYRAKSGGRNRVELAEG